MDKIGATDNFFELGGTSLMVTRVIIEADKAGHHIAYGDVFANPTPRLLAKHLSGESADSEALEDTDAEVSNFDYTDINNLLQKNSVETFHETSLPLNRTTPLGNVLLTGATGFLGIHVLRELIDSEAETITCLVRGRDQRDAERRLRNLLFYYFSRRFDDLFGTRLFVVNGDVTSDFTNAIARCHNNAINTVFNCAANVKHFSKGTDIEDVNIGGAKQCVDFCLATGAALVHVSTTSTGGIWIGDRESVPVLHEQSLYFGQKLGNQYMHSKFLADRLILDAVAHKGLRAKIMRVGNLAQPVAATASSRSTFPPTATWGASRSSTCWVAAPMSSTTNPQSSLPSTKRPALLSCWPIRLPNAPSSIPTTPIRAFWAMC
ncbi:MAG: SDR family oxidoreductase [Bacteroidales bacterium]|nr:SDR family oxidoreductase [Bacteroidales bacterium]